MKYLVTVLLPLPLALLSACASQGLLNYQGPTSGPVATVNLFAPSIQSSAANTELDFEVFQAQPDCTLQSLGWIQLTPSNHQTTITVAADKPLFMRLDYFQTDIVLARNNRGEVKFALEPTSGAEYTVEYKNTSRLFDMDIWQGSVSNSEVSKAIEPLEWNERNGKVLFRGKLDCVR